MSVSGSSPLCIFGEWAWRWFVSPIFQGTHYIFSVRPLPGVPAGLLRLLRPQVLRANFPSITFDYSLSSIVPTLYDVIPPSRSSTLSGLHPSAVTPHDVAGDLRTVAARFVSGCFSRPPGAIHVVISIPGHPPCPLDTTLNRTLLPPRGLRHCRLSSPLMSRRPAKSLLHAGRAGVRRENAVVLAAEILDSPSPLMAAHQVGAARIHVESPVIEKRLIVNPGSRRPCVRQAGWG